MRRSDELGEMGVSEVVNRRWQHDQRAAGELTQHADDAGIEFLGQDLGGIHVVLVGDIPFAVHGPLGLHPGEHRIHHARLRR